MRYVSVPRSRPAPRASAWTDDYPMLPAVCAPETLPVDTGLLDARGDKIMRVSPPIGFGRDEDW